MTDVLVRGGRLVTEAGERDADVAITDGLVSAVGPELDADGAEVLGASGLLVLPGVVDPHVHFNDPGRAHWEGFATGTAALAAGGTTCAADMPLNSTPPTVDAGGFDRKVAAAEGALRVDMALWGGLVPGPLDRLDELAARGVVGFKAFMSDSGIADFARADDDALLAGMERAAALGLPVAVHAESEPITRRLAARARAEGRTAMRDFLASRPAVAEVEAVGRALAYAEATGCALHVVHLSTGRAVALVAEARERGVDATCEVCAHHLVLDEEDAERLGAVAKCAPPLRPAAEVDAVWEHVRAGRVGFLATDHSPSPADMKGGDVLSAWGGISGAQLLLALAFDATTGPRRLDRAELPRLLAGAAAARLGLAPAKGALEPGADADLALVDPRGSWTVRADDLHDRHRLSPYAGRRLRGRVVRTLLRGRTVARDGVPVGDPAGRILRRQAA